MSSPKRKRDVKDNPDELLIRIPKDAWDEGVASPSPNKKRKLRYKAINHTVDTSEFYNSLQRSYFAKNTKLLKKTKKTLVTSLLPYQVQALTWMTAREECSALPGGILADEMGLGKTLEVLALTYCRMRQPSKQKTLSGLFPTQSTLVVVPQILLSQWQQEIDKHSKNKNSYFVYNGIQKLSKPQQKKLKRGNKPLFCSHIVLTSYKTLCKEVHYASDMGYSLRSSNQRKYTYQKSPLMLHQWWRVCIDEAQEVKSTAKQSAQMAKIIPAVHRWAVSGTPIKTSFNDLKGLMEFLGCPKKWQLETKELLKWLKTITWRNEKAWVEQHIKIPPPSDSEQSVILDPYERYCRRIIRDKMMQIDGQEKVLARFHTMPYYTMLHDVYDKVLKKTHNNTREKALSASIEQCTGALHGDKLLLCTRLNKLGIAYYGDDKVDKAIECLTEARNILRCEDRDPLLYNLPISTSGKVRYQTLINLSQIQKEVDVKGCEEANEEAYSVKMKWLAPRIKEMGNRRGHMQEELFQVDTLSNNRMRNSRPAWWRRMLDYLEDKEEKAFLEQLKVGVEQTYDTLFTGPRKEVLVIDVSTFKQLKARTENSLENIYTTRDKLLCMLEEPISKRKGEIDRFKNIISQAETLLSKYEGMLAYVKDEGWHTNRFCWLISETERLLLLLEYRAILAYNALFKEYQEATLLLTPTRPELQALMSGLSLITLEASAHFRELEVMKLEIVSAAKLINEMNKYVEKHEIIELGTDVEVPEGTSIAVLEQDVTDAKEQCDVRRKELDFLLSQKQVIVPNAEFGSKLKNAFNDLVDTLEHDTQTKVLVFSQFPQALIQFMVLLESKGIRFAAGRSLPRKGSLVGSIESFKSDDNVRVLLLNTVKQSTGLTLTQANHVFLLDTVDEASEAQAIGRSYRIGQMMSTQIRRYVVNTNDPMDVDT